MNFSDINPNTSMVHLISVVLIEDSDFILISIWCENNYHFFFCIRIYTLFRNDRLMLNWIAIIFWNTKTHIYFFPSALSVYKSFHRLLEDPPSPSVGDVIYGPPPNADCWHRTRHFPNPNILSMILVLGHFIKYKYL